MIDTLGGFFYNYLMKTKLSISKLTPVTRDYIWGGELLGKWGKGDGKVAESWELSFNESGASRLADGRALCDIAGAEDLGANIADFPFFPMLVKLINSADNLSVQVHPGDRYALRNEQSLGKTEMWYIISADEGCGIYLGFKDTVSEEDFESAISDNTIMDLLNFYPVKAGECYFVPSGTIHAIGRGVTLCEIQQNSNLTYRVYDYGRVGADGNPRQLHISKALEVTNLKAFKNRTMNINEGDRRRIGISKYFTAFEYDVKGEAVLKSTPSSFLSVTAVGGSGTIGGQDIKIGDTFFVPAGIGEVKVSGTIRLIVATVIQYFSDVSFDDNYITASIVDEYGFVIAEKSKPRNKKAGFIAKESSDILDELLEENNMSIDDLTA